MFTDLLSSPTRFPTATAERSTCRWMRSTPVRHDGRRRQLAPGVWFTPVSSWKPASALDIGAIIPPVTERIDADFEPVLPTYIWPDWHALALCNGMEPAKSDPMFFGVDDANRPALPPKKVAEARSYCRACPAVRDCLTWSLEHDEEFGIWGGKTGRQRRALMARHRAGESIADLVDECLTTMD